MSTKGAAGDCAETSPEHFFRTCQTVLDGTTFPSVMGGETYDSRNIPGLGTWLLEPSRAGVADTIIDGVKFFAGTHANRACIAPWRLATNAECQQLVGLINNKYENAWLIQSDTLRVAPGFVGLNLRRINTGFLLTWIGEYTGTAPYYTQYTRMWPNAGAYVGNTQGAGNLMAVRCMHP